MPGSPPINVTPPGTNPPPSARSNSGSPDGQRSSDPGCTSESLTTLAVDETAAVALLVDCRDSSSVFQALHAEHWPCHLLATAPQSRQTNVILPFAITLPFKSIYYRRNLLIYFNEKGASGVRTTERVIAKPGRASRSYVKYAPSIEHNRCAHRFGYIDRIGRHELLPLGGN